MRNALIFILILGVLVLGLLLIKAKNQNDTRVLWPETEPATQTNNYQNTNIQNSGTYDQVNTANQTQQSYTNWIEQKNGWYYPPGWDIYSKEINSDSFAFINQSTETGIRVGGLVGSNFETGCNENQVETFNYGVSTSACVNGVFVFLFNPSARWLPSQVEKNTFGDFVLRNRN